MTCFETSNERKYSNSETVKKQSNETDQIVLLVCVHKNCKDNVTMRRKVEINMSTNKSFQSLSEDKEDLSSKSWTR